MLLHVPSLDILSISKIDNFKSDTFNDPHVILDPLPLEVSEVFERLLRISNQQKVHIDHMKWYTTNEPEEAHKKKNYLVEKLYSVDYSEDWVGEESLFMAQLSFTMLDWLIMDRMVKHPDFQVENIDQEQTLRICFNIFPKSQTLLHKLAGCAGQMQQVAGLENISDTVLKIFAILKKGINFSTDSFDKDQPFEMPIFEDWYGSTCIEKALDCDQIGFKGFFQKMPSAPKPRDFKALLGIAKEFCLGRQDHQRKTNVGLAALIFDQIKDYKYLHSGPLLTFAVIESIKSEVPGMAEFLMGRLVRSEHALRPTQKRIPKRLMQHFIKESEEEDQAVDMHYGTLEVDMWARHSALNEKMFAN